MNFEKVFFLKKEIDAVKKEIANFEQLNGSNKELLLLLLKEKEESYCDEILKITNFIDEIKDRDVRLIARLRFIDNLTWEKIGEQLHMDRTTCYRKLNNYLNLHK